MGLRDVTEITLSYLQYVVLLVGVVPSPFPEFMTLPLEYARYLYLNLQSLFGSGNDSVLRDIVPSSIPLDVRFQFIVVSVLLPLFLSVVGLVLLAPKTFLLWYLGLLVVTVFSAIGFFARVVNDSIVIDAIGNTNVNVMLFAGLSVLLVLIAMAVAWKVYDSSEQSANAVRRYEDIEAAYTDSLDVRGLIFHLIYIVFAMLVALWLLGVALPLLPDAQSNLGTGPAAAIAVFFIIFSLCVGAWAVTGFFYTGRKWRFRVAFYSEKHCLSVLLLALSLLYIPCMSNVVYLSNCTTHQCPRGSRHLSARSDLVVANSTDGICVPCDWWPGQQCATAHSMCVVADAEDRLQTDLAVPCSEIRAYLWPACGFITLGIAVGLPAVYFYLTHRATEQLAEEFPLHVEYAVGLTDDEAFEEKAFLSENVAKFIYSPFWLRWRHWRMLFIIQKVVLTFAGVFVFSFSGVDSSLVAFFLFAFTNIIVLVYTAVTRPFISRLENYLVISTNSLLIVLAVVGIIGNTTGLSTGVMVPFVVLCVLVPIGAAAVGYHFTQQDKAEKNELKLQRAQDAVKRLLENDNYEAQFDTQQNPFAGTMCSLPERERRRSGVADEGDARRLQAQRAKNRGLPPRRDERRAMTVEQMRARAANVKGARNPLEGPHARVQISTSPATIATSPVASPSASPMDSPLPSPRRMVPPRERDRDGAVPLKLSSKVRSKVKRAVEEASDDSDSAASVGSGPLFEQAFSKGSRGISVAARAAARDTSHLRGVGGGGVEAGAGSGGGVFASALDRAAVFDGVAPLGGFLSRTNTEEESQRALKFWKAAKIGVLKQVRKKLARRGGAEQKQAGWSQLMVLMMKKENDRLQKLQRRKASISAPDMEQLISDMRRGSNSEQVRERFEDVMTRHGEKMKSLQAGVDYAINQRINLALQIYFMILGVLTFLAFGCSILALVKHSKPATFVAAGDSDALAGHATWAAFVGDCCCTAGVNQTGTTAVTVEHWICADGKVKERLRATATGAPMGAVTDAAYAAAAVVDGYDVRAVCATTFRNGCAYNDNNGTVTCPPAVPPAALQFW